MTPRSWKQVGGELIVVVVLIAWSRQIAWTLVCALVLLPGLRSVWWPRRRSAAPSRPSGTSPLAE